MKNCRLLIFSIVFFTQIAYGSQHLDFFENTTTIWDMSFSDENDYSDSEHSDVSFNELAASFDYENDDIEKLIALAVQDKEEKSRQNEACLKRKAYKAEYNARPEVKSKKIFTTINEE